MQIAWRSQKEEVNMEIILWLLAAILVLSGIKKVFNGEVLLGVVFVVVGLVVGPGGASLFI